MELYAYVPKEEYQEFRRTLSSDTYPFSNDLEFEELQDENGVVVLKEFKGVFSGYGEDLLGNIMVLSPGLAITVYESEVE